MRKSFPSPPGSSTPEWLVDGGEMGELVRSTDWSATPLGPRESWPQELRTALSMVLGNRFPMALLWGPELVMLYNDEYRAVAADRHPRAVGRSPRELWPERWREFAAALDGVMRRGETVYREDELFPVEREGRREDAYFTLCYSPVRSADGTVAGILVTRLDTTRRLEHARTLQTQRDRAAAAAAREHEALRESEQKYRTLAESTPEVIARFDRSLAHTYVNAYGARVYGLPVSQVIGRTNAELGMPAENVAFWERHFEEVFATGEQRTVDFEFDSPTFGHQYFSSIFVPERDERGEVASILALTRDVTELRRAERALRSSEAKFRSVFEQAAIGMARVRFDDARWVDVNEAFCRMLGRRREEMLRTAWPDVTHPEDVDLDLVPFRRMAAGELDNYTVEKRFIHASGEHVWARLTLSLVRDPAGNPDYEIAIIEDIGDRKQAEEARTQSEGALRRSEARFRDLADNIAQLAWMADAHGLASWYNRRWYEYTGTDLEDARAWGWTEVVHPDHVTRVVEKLERSFASGEVWEDTFPLRAKNGEYRWFLSRAVPIRDESGRVLRWFGTNTDVTEQRLAELRLRTIVETVPVGLFILEPGGRVSLMNGEARRVWAGSTRLESVSDYSRRKGFWPGSGEPLAPDEWPGAQALLHGRTLHGVLIDIERLDGTRGTIVASGAPIRDEKGRIVGAVAANQDVTELRQVQERLEESDRRKTEFLALLSHELRNPLTPIRNSIHIMERTPPGGEQARRALTVIDRQVTQMARLIEELLDVTRISRGIIRLQRARIELNEVVRGAGEDLRSLFQTGGVELALSITDRPLHAHADRTRVAQVVGNLLQNASKFTPPGGRVELSLDAERGQAVITVRDTGAGMEPHLVDTLFEPFVQAEATVDRTRGGLGLGLALVKGLVELHGGTVTAHSEGPGCGSEFRVTLPLLAAAETLPVEGVSRATGSAVVRKLRVLVIEDNEDAAESLKEALELSGHAVEAAGTGPEGIEKARAFGPDVVLCDIGLPGMDGFDVARAMKDDPLLRDTCLVALSGYAAPEDLEKARAAGFAQHVAKPPDLDVLESTLVEVCSAARPAAS